MVNQLKSWKGRVLVNGVEYDSIESVDFSTFTDDIHIVLSKKSKKSSVDELESAEQYLITVKKYMTQKATPEFDFMAKWNNDNPMPYMTMVGEEIKQTRGMVYMRLHGDVVTGYTQNCIKCGKPITNDVSRYFGIGPVCGGHNYVNPFDTDEELKDAIKKYREQLRTVVWEGWIIKSAITTKEVYNG